MDGVYFLIWAKPSTSYNVETGEGKWIENRQLDFVDMELESASHPGRISHCLVLEKALLALWMAEAPDASASLQI